MREDYLQNLDQMFPEGYVIVYTCPNGTARMSLYNPNKYELIDKCHKILKDNVNG